MIKALKNWTSKKDELTKYHKLQVPIEINPQNLIKSLEKEMKEDEVRAFSKRTKMFPNSLNCMQFYP